MSDRWNNDRNEFKREAKEAQWYARETGKNVAPWIIGFFALAIIIGLGTWAWTVLASDPKGAGDTIITNNSSENRVRAQNEYVQLFNGIQAADDNIQTLSDAFTRNPNQINEMNLTGAQQICKGNVAKYNALATATLTSKWIPEGFPTTIGQDMDTDCKPDMIATPAPTASN